MSERASVLAFLRRRGWYFWTYESRPETKAWNAKGHLGRTQFGVAILRHRYPNSSALGDRWVVQPSLIVDRRGEC